MFIHLYLHTRNPQDLRRAFLQGYLDQCPQRVDVLTLENPPSFLARVKFCSRSNTAFLTTRSYLLSTAPPPLPPPGCGRDELLQSLRKEATSEAEGVAVDGNKESVGRLEVSTDVCRTRPSEYVVGVVLSVVALVPRSVVGDGRCGGCRGGSAVGFRCRRGSCSWFLLPVVGLCWGDFRSRRAGHVPMTRQRGPALFFCQQREHQTVTCATRPGGAVCPPPSCSFSCLV